MDISSKNCKIYKGFSRSTFTFVNKQINKKSNLYVYVSVSVRKKVYMYKHKLIYMHIKIGI